MSCYTCKCKPVLFPALSCLVRACQLSKLALYLYLSVFCSIQFLAAASISIVAIFQQVVTAEISGSFKKKIQISSLALDEKNNQEKLHFFSCFYMKVSSYCSIGLERGKKCQLFPTIFSCLASQKMDVGKQALTVTKQLKCIFC